MVHFLPALRSGIGDPSGTDMNCDGVVDSADYSGHFQPQLLRPEPLPGPSGLDCAGSVPCQ